MGKLKIVTHKSHAAVHNNFGIHDKKTKNTDNGKGNGKWDENDKIAKKTG